MGRAWGRPGGVHAEPGRTSGSQWRTLGRVTQSKLSFDRIILSKS